MRELEYPFDSNYVLKNKIYLKRKLQEDGDIRIPIRIAVLGGSTTHDICEYLQIFLLNQGLDPAFYESEYNRYWEEAIFTNENLRKFNPDIIYIHTSTRNINVEIKNTDTLQDIEKKLNEQYYHFEKMWDKLRKDYQCPIIQNNFERPLIRLYGNKDISDIHGFSNFISRLNDRFYKYSQNVSGFYINDIDYMSSVYGLDRWSNLAVWYMYKYAMAIEAIPDFCFNLSNIIKSIFGKNKKVLSVDLDNTLWEGVISEEGVNGIGLGKESAIGETYVEIQRYIKNQKEIGILLAINSKNELSSVESAFSHPDTQLCMEDFSVIDANWKNKDENIIDIAKKLNLGLDSIVFMDDNPVERAIVSEQLPEVEVPELNEPEEYIKILNRAGYFEVTDLTEEDKERTKLYQSIEKRNLEMVKYEKYSDFLKSLNMESCIREIDENNIHRIVQLVNKSNQFNLTTRRYTENDIRKFMVDRNYVCLYGRLKDKYGDNGIVSVLIARKEGKDAHIDLFLMSCRVLKRGMEDVMMDELFNILELEGCTTVVGYYYRTKKNSMVENFYQNTGFKLLTDTNDCRIYIIDIRDYQKRNKLIRRG